MGHFHVQHDYSHRKTRVLERLAQLSSVLAIDICAYATGFARWLGYPSGRPSKRTNEMPESDTPRTRPDAACPCGCNKDYAQCCEPLHKGEAAGSAEALMRSRYSAFCLNLPEYLERSWHSSTRPKNITEEHAAAVKPRWMGLRIKRHETIDSDHALVEFTARYKLRGRVFTLHEISRFVRENGHWFYVDGTFPRS